MKKILLIILLSFTFSLGFSQLVKFSNLQGVNRKIITQFVDDSTLSAGSHTNVPNEWSIKNYILNRLGGGGGGSSYIFNSGLTNTAGTVRNNLITGLANGQTINGGTGSGENLALQSTTNATKGLIFFGGVSAYNQANDKLGIGTTNPLYDIHIAKSGSANLAVQTTTNTSYSSINSIANGTYTQAIAYGNITPYSYYLPNMSEFTGSGSNGVVIAANHLTGNIRFVTGTNNVVGTFTGNGLTVGSPTLNNSAKFEVTSTDRGMLIPRMTTAQRNAVTAPANSLLIFNTTTAQFEYYYGAAWLALASGGGGVDAYTSITTLSDSSGAVFHKATTSDTLKFITSALDAGAYRTVASLPDSSGFKLIRGNGTQDTVSFPSLSGGSGYTLPIASSSTLGGIKVGSGLSIDGTGILSNTSLQEVTLVNAVTLTNKRITPRIQTVVSAASITPNMSSDDQLHVTALAVNTVIGGFGGTATDGQPYLIRIKDDGTARTITWNGIFRESTDFALPTTTVAGKTMYIQFVYNAADARLDAIGLTQGF